MVEPVELRERILLKAEELFWKYGIRSITMDDIAKDVGISKKTIYQQFTDKDEIVYQVTLYRLDRNRDNVDCSRASASDPIGEMFFASAQIRKHIADMNPALVIDIQRHHPRAWKLFTDYRDKYVLESIRVNLLRGVEEGLYRPDIDVDVMARLRVELINMAFNAHAFPMDRLSMMDVQLQLLHHFIRGILTYKGFTIYNQYATQYQTEKTSVSS